MIEFLLLTLLLTSCVRSSARAATGAAPTNERAAVHRRMRRLADEMGLFLNETQARIAVAKRSVRGDPEVLRTLQAIVRNMGASFKSEDGFTPADRAVLPPKELVEELWGTTGSQSERSGRR